MDIYNDIFKISSYVNYLKILLIYAMNLLILFLQ